MKKDAVESIDRRREGRESLYWEKKTRLEQQQQHQPESETFKLFMSCCVVTRAKKFQFCRPPSCRFSRRGGAAFRRIPFSFNPPQAVPSLAENFGTSGYDIRVANLPRHHLASIPNILRSLIDSRICLMRFRAPIGTPGFKKIFQIISPYN